MSDYRDLPLWQASDERDRRIIERAWSDMTDEVPLWVRQYVASFAPFTEAWNRAVVELVINLNQVLTPERVINSAITEYNRRMAEINKR